jgi:hypothetical protein
MGMLLKAFPDMRVEADQILASGDHVAARLRMTGTHKGNFAGVAPTNKSVSWGSCSVVQIRDGKAIRSRIYADYASVFQQLGVLSLPKTATAGQLGSSNRLFVDDRELVTGPLSAWTALAPHLQAGPSMRCTLRALSRPQCGALRAELHGLKKEPEPYSSGNATTLRLPHS